jgi:C_GCAxxG_C_C family probable redox protein
MLRQAQSQMQSGLHCAEAVVITVLQNFSDTDPAPAVRAASAFGGGIAGSTQELCGAFSGGVIALGSLWGRSQPGLELKECARLVKEFKQRFEREFGGLQCRPLLDAQAQEGGSAPSCLEITGRAASLLGEILGQRQELGGQAPGLGLQSLAQAHLAPGACPFGGCGC